TNREQRELLKTQAELYQYGAINQQKTGLTKPIYFDNQLINLNWNGDAVVLLGQLATQRGYSFDSTGVKLPLPITIQVKNMGYSDVLDRIQMQIGYRAGIVFDSNKRAVFLNYTSPTTHTNDTPLLVVRIGHGSNQPLSNVSALSPRGIPVAQTLVLPSAHLQSPAKGQKMQVPYTEIRNGNGNNQPLRKALQQIAPVGWDISISADIEKENRKVSWIGGDRWTNVLDKMLIDNSLTALVDSPIQRVSVAKQQPGKSAGIISVTPYKTTSTAQSTTSKSGTMLVPTVVGTVAKSTALVSPSTIKPIIVAKPMVANPAKQVWSAPVGSTLRESIIRWGQEAKCQNGISDKWVIIWPSKVDYRIDAALTFSGKFEEALVNVFELYRKADRPLFVDANRNQCLVYVDDKPRN
uniref:DotD/TraH family lipoprotein n=1 Tax=Yersinia aldovae TaxID=29483 RepID=UPI0011A0F4EC